MKVISQENSASVLSSRGAGSSTTFGIAASSHMFQMLSSGLYSDKVSAVLREVGCNAYDAHIAAGIENTPIEVKLPTELDRTFYIKDWGLGLDADEITAIYTVYGVSTKQTCEKQTGGFGLGSKSPFAYTLADIHNPDGFTIVSAKNGIQRTYVAHLNDEGAPTVTLLNEQPSSEDWPSGVQVMFPVRDRDFSEFHNKAAKIYSLFNVPPRLLGTTVELEKAKCQYPINESAGFDLVYPNGDYEVYPSLIMANVCYPLSIPHLGDLTDHERFALRAPLILSVPNGVVSLTPSRESLQYTEETIRVIKNLVRTAVNSLQVRFEESITQVSNLNLNTMDKLKELDTVFNSFPYSLLSEVIEHCLRTGNDKLVEERKLLRRWEAKSLNVPAYVGRRQKADFMGPDTILSRCRVWEYRNRSNGTERLEIISNGYASRSGRRTDGIPVAQYKAKNVIIFDEPGVTYSLARVKVYVENNLEVFSRYSRKSHSDRVFFISTHDTGAKQFAKVLAEIWSQDKEAGFDGIEVFGVSEIEIPIHLAPKASGSSRKASPRTTWDDTMSRFWDLKGKYHFNKVNSEFTENQKFYINIDTRDGDYVEICPETGDTIHSIRHSQALTLMRGLAAVASKAGFEAEGLLILENRNRATLNRYISRGFKPFISTAVEVLANNWELATAEINPISPVSLEITYSANRIGVLGHLARLKKHAPAVWDAVKPENAKSAVNLEIDSILKHHDRSKSDDEVDNDNALRWASNLVEKKLNKSLQLSVHMSTDYVSRLYKETYPSLPLINLSFLENIENDEFLEKASREWEWKFSNTESIQVLKSAINMIESIDKRDDKSLSILDAELLAVTSEAQQKVLGIDVEDKSGCEQNLKAA